jgi:hypothetical protein
VDVGRLLFFAGMALAVVGGLIWLGAKAGPGRLPGDILIDRGNLHIAIPIITSIVLSLALTIALNIAFRLAR